MPFNELPLRAGLGDQWRCMFSAEADGAGTLGALPGAFGGRALPDQQQMSNQRMRRPDRMSRLH
jgi:hypothetical protein